MELLTVERYNLKPDWTIGRLLVQGEPVGFTMEDEIRKVKVHGETAIPYGTYELGLRQSPKFSDEYLWSDSHQILIQKSLIDGYPQVKDFRPHDLIWIKNVPNFEYILLHWGNFDDETDGCLIVGAMVGFANNKHGIRKEAVLVSRQFYRALYPKIYSLIKNGSQKISICKAK